MKLIRFAALSAILVLAACSKTTPTDQPVDAAAALAKPPAITVNGKAISAEMLEDYVKAVAQKPSAELPPEDVEQIKENLVRIELIAQQAEKDGLTKETELANRLELSRLNIIQQAAAQNHLKDFKATEAELRAEYDSQLASSSLVEYQARHILVTGEDVAQKVIQQLNAGQDFAGLAKRLSIDKESAKAGGDLGWFAPNRMVKPFADAVALLKKGEVTKTPIQTQFGWHVIQLQNTRDRTPPPFDQVKEQINEILMTRRFKAHSDEMLKAAKIEPPLSSMPSAAPSTPASTPAAD